MLSIKKLIFRSILLLFFGAAVQAQSEPVSVVHSSNSQLTQSEKKSLIQDLIKMMQEKRYPGIAFAAIHGDDILVKGAVGYSDVKKGDGINPDEHLFNVGSISKLITSFGIHHLIKENDDSSFKISYDTKVSDVLPWMSDSRFAGITIRHLLTHRSGLPRHIGGTNTSDYDQLDEGMYSVPGVQARQLVQKLEMIHQPGVFSKYANLGYYILGEVIVEVAKKRGFQFKSEKFSHQVAQVLTAQVLKPLGLHEDLFFMTGKEPKGKKFITGYSGLYDADENYSDSYRIVMPKNIDGGCYQTAAGLMSTAKGMALLGARMNAWIQGEFKYGVLSQPLFQAMLGLETRDYKFDTVESAAFGYGKGIMYSQLVKEKNAAGEFTVDPMIGHSGSAAGGKSILFCHPQKLLCVYASINAELTDRNAVGRLLFKYFANKLPDQSSKVDKGVQAAVEQSVMVFREKTALPAKMLQFLPVVETKATIANLKQALLEEGKDPNQVDSLLSAPFYDGKAIGYGWRKKMVAIDDKGNVQNAPYSEDSLIAIQTAAKKPAVLFLDKHKITGEAVLRMGYQDFLGYSFEPVTWDYDSANQEVSAIYLSNHSLRAERFKGNGNHPVVLFK